MNRRFETNTPENVISRTLIIKNVPTNCTRSDIEAIFRRYGVLEDCYLLQDFTRRVCGAVVTYATRDAALEALRTTNNSAMVMQGCDSPLAVQVAEYPEERQTQDHQNRNLLRQEDGHSRENTMMIPLGEIFPYVTRFAVHHCDAQSPFSGKAVILCFENDTAIACVHINSEGIGHETDSSALRNTPIRLPVREFSGMRVIDCAESPFYRNIAGSSSSPTAADACSLVMSKGGSGGCKSATSSTATAASVTTVQELKKSERNPDDSASGISATKSPPQGGKKSRRGRKNKPQGCDVTQGGTSETGMLVKQLVASLSATGISLPVSSPDLDSQGITKSKEGGISEQEKEQEERSAAVASSPAVYPHSSSHQHQNAGLPSESRSRENSRSPSGASRPIVRRARSAKKLPYATPPRIRLPFIRGWRPCLGAKYEIELVHNSGSEPTDRELIPEGATLCVTGFSKEVTGAELELIFRTYGTLLRVEIFTRIDIEDGPDARFALVSYDDPASARAAAQFTLGTQLGPNSSLSAHVYSYNSSESESK